MFHHGVPGFVPGSPESEQGMTDCTDSPPRLNDCERAFAQVRTAIWQLHASEDYQQLLVALANAAESLGVRFGFFGVNLINLHHDPVSGIGHYRTPDEQWHQQRYPTLVGAPLLRIWQQQEPVYRPDLERDDPYMERSSVGQRGVRCLLDVPFSHGTLAVSSRTPDAFPPPQRAVMELLAGLCSEGFRRLDELNDLQRRTREAEALSAAVMAVAGAGSLDEVLLAVVQESVRLAQGTRGIILLYDEREAALTPRALVGFGPEVQRYLRVRPGEYVSGQVFLSGKSMLYDLSRMFTDGTLRAETRELLARSIGPTVGTGAVVPLHVRGQVAGTLAVRGEQHRCDQRTLDLLESLAAQAGVAIERAEVANESRVNLALQRATNQVLQMDSEQGWNRLLAVVQSELPGLIGADPAAVRLFDGRQYPTPPVPDQPTDTQASLLYSAGKGSQARYRRNREEIARSGGSAPANAGSVVEVSFTGGNLVVSSVKEEAFRRQDIQILERFAQVFSEGYRRIQDLRRAEESRQQMERSLKLDLGLQRLRSEVQLMLERRDWKRVAECFYKELQLAVPCYRSSIQLVNRRGRVYSGYYTDEGYTHPSALAPMPASLQEVMQLGRPCYRRTREELQWYGDLMDPEVACAVDVPFLGGTVAMNSTREQAFDEQHIHTLERFAQVMSEAYQRRVQLEQQAAAQQVRMAVWRMGSSEDLDQVLEVMRSQLLGNHLHFSDLEVVVVESGDGQRRVRRYTYQDQDGRGRWSNRIEALDGQTLPGRRSWENGELVYRRDLHAEDPSGGRGLFPEEIRSAVEVPFVHGALVATSDVPDAFDESDLGLLQTLANTLSEGFRRVDDLVGLEKARAQLLRAQKLEAVGQLAAGIAHNFNNLLQANLANIGLAMRGDATAEGRHFLEEAETAGLRGAELVQQLMLFTRAETREPVLKPVDLGEVVRAAVSLCRKTIDLAIDLRLELPNDLPLVWGEARQLEQVVVNLLLNGRDALEGVVGREAYIAVRVGVEKQEASDWATPRDAVWVEVVDNGTGMDAQTQTRLFEPFFTTKEVGKGTGLGLATVYGIVQRHGGKIECRSSLDAGSTFVFHVPAVETQSPVSTAAEEQAGPRGGSEMLLIVDDEDLVRHSTCKVLESLGYRVLEADNGVRGLELFRQHAAEIGLILLDLSMPGISGREVLQRLCAEERRPKVVVFTGYAVDQDELAGASAVLSKPFSLRQLAGAVRRILDT